ncbi:MAG: D-alanyl-D-alanine carboxypeptidase [Chromatiales bacterium]|nr:D-alanyl-D-alanine carboxypeptidase [Chromatiales bacterium]
MGKSTQVSSPAPLYYLRLLVSFTLLLFVAGAASAKTDSAGYKAVLVMDAESGEVLHQENGYDEVIPASLVKMMTGLIVFDRIGKGKLSLLEQYTVSAKASRIGGHQVYLKQGETFTIGQLLKAVLIGSANDAAYAIAEHIGGTHEAFVKMMNSKARQIGMKHTVFTNAHGLPPNRRKGQKDNKTTAYDMALLGRDLIKHPLAKRWASTELDSFRDGTFQLINTNRLFLRTVEGAEGLKTGYHSRGAGFNLVGSAVREDRRLLVVVMGAKNPRGRVKVAGKLLDRAFAGKL